MYIALHTVNHYVCMNKIGLKYKYKDMQDIKT
jgi:hypothetical protein